MGKKILSLLLIGTMLFSAAGVHASEEEIAAIESQKAADEASLAAANSNIASLTAKQQELTAYLSELSAQYDALTAEIAELDTQAATKEEELKKIRENQESAKTAADKQYENMKLRIAYIYENGGMSALANLLDSENLADFINRAENVRQISEYDRTKLEEYNELQKQIEESEAAAEAEIEEINALLQERAVKKDEVSELVASTNDSIASYAYQISASQEEAAYLMAEINAADASINNLLIQQAAALEAAQQEAAHSHDHSEHESYEEDSYYEEEETYEESYDYSEAEVDYDYDEESDEDTYEESYYEESYVEDSYEESYAEETSASSGSSQGTYLGNFTLTAYCNCAICCGTAGNLTASGTVPTAGRTVAMAGVPFGTQLLINGTVYTVEDLGTPYGHVDIYMNSHDAALSFGLQSAEVYQLS